VSNRLFRNRVFGILVALLLMPGWIELAETIEHLMHDGHLPHSEAHADSDDEVAHEGDEHGCTQMVHHCQCHTSSPALVADAEPEHDAENAVDAPGQAVDLTRIPTSWAQAPPTRPPIA